MWCADTERRGRDAGCSELQGWVALTRALIAYYQGQPRHSAAAGVVSATRCRGRCGRGRIRHALAPSAGWHDDVRVIDFDDCGFGYWLHDIAVALWELRHRHDYERFRDALIAEVLQNIGRSLDALTGN